MSSVFDYNDPIWKRLESKTPEELFRASLKKAISMEDPYRSLELTSIYSQIDFSNDPELFHSIYREETAPEQVEIILHINGENIINHKASAFAVGEFLTNISEGVHQIGKSILKEYNNDNQNKSQKSFNHSISPILVEGIQPGSVKLVLAAPDLPDKNDEYNDYILDIVPESIESKSLLIFSKLLNNVSSGDSIDAFNVLDYLPYRISRKGISHIKKISEIVFSNNWDISGEAIKRGSIENIHFSSRGAARLLDALQAKMQETTREWVAGQLDGHKNSNRKVFFKPENGDQRSYSLEAASLDILTTASRVSADPNNYVNAHIEISPVIKKGKATGDLKRKLLDIEIYPSYREEPLL